MTLLQHPVPPPLQRRLRRAVQELAGATARKSFRPVLHVGEPGVRVARQVCHAEPDLDLRVQIAAALLHRVRERVPQPLAWLSRPGPLTWHDLDAVWVPAVVQAFAEAEVELTLVVVTRHGWWDPRSDARQEWQRVRRRGSR